MADQREKKKQMTEGENHKLRSPWSQGDIRKGEYPRPHMVRTKDWHWNLNGYWDYAIGNSSTPPDPEEYEGKILVPFSPESVLSGVERVLSPLQYLHYRTVVSLSEEELFRKGHILLHFGAVDQECIVYVNGTAVGEHKGGYLSFSFAIERYLHTGDNELLVVVRDRTEQAPYARGKQRYVNDGPLSSIFYQGQSGIWKTVWMEWVPESYIEEIHVIPDCDRSQVSVRVLPKGSGTEKKEVRVSVFTETEGERQEIGHGTAPLGKTVSVPMNGYREWSPDDPFLYSMEITMGEDSVQTSFGMRCVTVEKDACGIARICLNHKPVFLTGVLDQAYWPESLMTAPSDEAMIRDILAMKLMGFNTIRMHVKVEEERFYSHCDRLGMLVIQDMPNGGGDYNMYFQAHFPNIGGRSVRGISDRDYRLFRREDPEGREQFLEELKGMIGKLRNHPSIIMWVPFNEGWGQFDAAKISKAVKRYDPTRLVNEACGWFDQGGGDLYSIHNYYLKLKVSPKGDRVVALTEFGGYSYPVEDHVYNDRVFGYRSYKSEEELTGHFETLYREQVIANIPSGLSCAIYTQLSDLFEEVNGLMTFDRKVIKISADTVRELNLAAMKMLEAAAAGIC